MTLDELLAADEQTKGDLGSRMYKKLVELYCDQHRNDTQPLNEPTQSITL